jgi:glyoxylase-like metal-dependent hydrolase (beta-lactamase superfamily II)
LASTRRVGPNPTTQGSSLAKLTDRVYTFNWYFDRTIVIDTDEGLVVTDPFSTHLSGALSAALAGHGLAKPCHTVIYSHFHLDHVRGAAHLAPVHVVAHHKCPDYWLDFDAHATADILAPTRLIDGDTTLTIGHLDIELLYLGLSHTDTLYAIHVPSEGVLYAADTVGIGVFLPSGGIALYTPGYFRALDRMAELDFTTFVGSHFGWGTKQQFLAAVEHQRDIHDWVRDAVRRHDGPVSPFQDRRQLLAIYDDVYNQIQAKYGMLHGFDTQALFAIVTTFTNEYVGN